MNSWVNVERPHFDLRSIAIPHAFMTSAGSALGIVTLLQTCWLSLSKGNLPSPDVLSLLLSKVLGLGIIAGASFVKVPQISTLFGSKSAEGLAASGFELENIGLTIHAAYGFLKQLPFGTYGEATIMLLQNTVLLALVYKYAKVPASRILTVAATNLLIIAAVATGRVSTQTATAAYDFNNVIFAAARVPQIVKNFQAKSTGQLSMFTYAFNSLGCIARMYTSHAEGGGFAMIRGFALGLLLNATTLMQILSYGSGKAKAKKA